MSQTYRWIYRFVGLPVSAAVSVWDAAGGGAGTGTTDEFGALEVTLPAGRYFANNAAGTKAVEPVAQFEPGTATFASSLSLMEGSGAVGNGTTDDAAAFSTATGTVYLRPNATYRIASSATLAAGLTILGQGATILFDTNGVLNISGTGVTLRGIQFTVTTNANSILISNTDYSNLTLTDCTVDLTGVNSTFLRTGWSGTNSTVSNVLITGSNYSGTVALLFYEAVDSFLHNVEVRNLIAASGITYNTSPIHLNSCVGTIVEGCIVTGCTPGSTMGGAGIALSGCDRCQVNGCSSYNNIGLDGLAVVAASKNISVTGGNYSNNAMNASQKNGDGIDVYGCIGLTISGVRCINNSQYGVELFEDGVSTNHAQDISVVGCHIVQNGFGGMVIKDVNQATIEACHIHHNARTGIVMHGSSGCTNIQVVGNQIWDNDQVHAGETQPGGIFIASDTNAFSIIGNTIYDDATGWAGGSAGEGQQYGINIQNTAHGGLVQSNRVFGNTSGQVWPASTTTPRTVVRDNVGYNPVGSVTANVFPASDVSTTNNSGFDITAFIANGTGEITQVAVGGISTDMRIPASDWTTIRIPAGQSITFTYASGSPAWKWIAD